MSEVRDCTTCGWGVKWERPGYWDNNLHGMCQFVPSFPVPPHFGSNVGFSERTPPQKDCPAWKKQRNPDVMQRWLEGPIEYRKRINAKLAEGLAFIEAVEKMQKQCLGCANEPQWECDRYGAYTGTCKAGMHLFRHLEGGVLVNDDFLSTVCPAHQPKTEAQR